MTWKSAVRSLLPPGSIARTAIMVIAGFVAFTIVGAAVEHRESDLLRLPASAVSLRMVEWAVAILQTSSVLGVLAMVLMQSFKQPLRGWFHFRALRQWLEQDEKALHEVLELIAPSYQQDILALPIEQFSAQLASAANVALLGQREHALRALAGKSAGPHITRYMQLLGKQTHPEPSADAYSEKPELLEVRSTISHIVQRRIDGFQIHVGNEWRGDLRIIAIIFSGGLAGLGILVSLERPDQPFTAAAFTLIVGLLGGLLASVARDLVAIIEKYRR